MSILELGIPSVGDIHNRGMEQNDTDTDTDTYAYSDAFIAYDYVESNKDMPFANITYMDESMAIDDVLSLLEGYHPIYNRSVPDPNSLNIPVVLSVEDTRVMFETNMDADGDGEEDDLVQITLTGDGSGQFEVSLIGVYVNNETYGGVHDMVNEVLLITPSDEKGSYSTRPYSQSRDYNREVFEDISSL